MEFLSAAQGVLFAWFTTVELVAVVASLLAVILTVKKNVWCWPIGLIGVTAYGFLFFDIKLYADMALQFIFFGQGLYGWYFWLRGGAHATPAPVERIGVHGFLKVWGVILILTSIVGFGLHAYTDASLPYLDSLLAVTSLVANMLLARKILENWVLWIIADVLYIGMFAYKGIYLTAGLYAVFLFLATTGLVSWLKEERLGKEAELVTAEN